MPSPRSKLRPRSTALWLGIAALVLQAFGAAIHARSHHGHRHSASLSLASPTSAPASRADHAHNHEHAHCRAHDAHSGNDEPSDLRRHASHPAEPASPHDHDECPTCLKLLSNARSAFTSAPDLPIMAGIRRESLTLGAERVRSIGLLRVQPARGPPSRSPTIA